MITHQPSTTINHIRRQQQEHNACTSANDNYAVSILHGHYLVAAHLELYQQDLLTYKIYTIDSYLLADFVVQLILKQVIRLKSLGIEDFKN